MLAVAALLVAAVPCSAEAGDNKAAWTFDLAAASKYVWRGLLVNDEFVLQPSVGITFGGFNANIWSSVDLTDYGAESGAYNGRKFDLQEVDYTVRTVTT